MDEEKRRMWKELSWGDWRRADKGAVRKTRIYPAPAAMFFHKTSAPATNVDLSAVKLTAHGSVHPDTEAYLVAALRKFHQPPPEGDEASASFTIEIHCQDALSFDDPPDGSNEGYSVLLAAGGRKAIVYAQSTAGAVHGFWTVVSLTAQGSLRGGTMIPMFIRDDPRYAYRGFSVDAARSPYSMRDLQECVEMAARAKFNVLHLRLTDDTGFLLENPLVSGCADCKADQLEQNRQKYSDAELRQLVQYAFVRGVRIVPEVDLPGHAQGWGPDLAMCCPGARKWGIPLKINQERTYKAVESVLLQLNAIFPDPLIHLGGDEFSAECFSRGENMACGQPDPNTCRGIENCLYYFEARLAAIVQGLPKRREVIRWMDLVESHGGHGVSPMIMHPEIYKDTWGMSWRGYNEVLILAGMQEHWGTFLPRPLSFPLILTSEQWYVPPHPDAKQKAQEFGCERCFDQFYKSPWGRNGVGMYEAPDVTKKVVRLPDSVRRRVKGGTIAAFEVAAPVLREWHSWAVVCAVAERLWSSADWNDPREALGRLSSNKDWLAFASVSVGPLESAGPPVPAARTDPSAGQSDGGNAVVEEAATAPPPEETGTTKEVREAPPAAAAAAASTPAESKGTAASAAPPVVEAKDETQEGPSGAGEVQKALDGVTREIFMTLDFNKDGHWDHDELGKAARETKGAFPQVSEAAFKSMDANGNGFIDPQEYRASVEAAVRRLTPENRAAAVDNLKKALSRIKEATGNL